MAAPAAARAPLRPACRGCALNVHFLRQFLYLWLRVVEGLPLSHASSLKHLPPRLASLFCIRFLGRILRLPPAYAPSERY